MQSMAPSDPKRVPVWRDSGGGFLEKYSVWILLILTVILIMVSLQYDFDVFLTIEWWFFQGGMFLLGVYVSLKQPPKSEHVRFILAFVVLFLGSVTVGITQSHRAAEAQKKLQHQLDAIQHNTERPPVINVQSPPPIVVAAKQRASLRLANVQLGYFNQTTFGANIFVRNTSATASLWDYVGPFGVYVVDRE